MTAALIAQIVCETLCAYRAAIHRITNPIHWPEVDEGERKAMVQRVRYLLANPLAHPIDYHAEWMEVMLKDGWVYGRRLDEDKKTNPLLRPYHELSNEARREDRLIAGVVRALEEK